MLELQNITKVYPAGGNDVHALKGISLQFRKSEFVSILGPSGCGKTTMLNIIGGLDRFTAGNMLINGRSTKEYKDRDWDTYRNHSVGFVFQSYNLIPHQTVLANVELALTLSGVSRSERRKRAIAALEQVGLGDQLRKKPNEMSGGQCQRVAIARAIVNDPDIILADEPTGALDTETSVQVMEILKKISEDRLVVMVTHNPELAESYSTRVIRMLDGRITDDTRPLTEAEAAAESNLVDTGKQKKPSMSYATSFGLSLKNLFTKKARTLLTAFAGSIGIIGIALIYAVSNGATSYINSVQEQTLSSYPLSIQSQTLDTSSLLTTFMGKAESVGQHENDAVYQKAMMYELMNAFYSLETRDNDLKAFKTWLEARRADENDPLHTALTGISYSYDLDLAVYTLSVDNKIIRSDTETIMANIMQQYMGTDMNAMIAMRDQMSMGMSSSMNTMTQVWKEILSGENGEPINEVVQKQYTMLYGRWPENYNEVILFVDEKNELNDMMLYALGLKSEAEIERVMTAAMNQQPVEYELENWSYSDLCSREYRVILDADSFALDPATGLYTDLRETETGLKYLYDNALTLKIVGIAKPDPSAVATEERGHIGYLNSLTAYILQRAEDSAAVQAQKQNPAADIFTGLAFRGTATGSLSTAEKAAAWNTYVNGLDEAGKAALARKLATEPDQATIDAAVEQAMSQYDRTGMENAMLEMVGSQMSMDENTIKAYLSRMSDEDIAAYFRKGVEEQVRQQYAATVEEKMGAATDKQLAMMLAMNLKKLSEDELAAMYDKYMTFSDSDYESNLKKLGCMDPEDPSTISLYASTFADKDTLISAISEYNESVDDMHEIRYTDYVGLIMSSVTTIIDAISYVLIAFVAVSLIVSSIMIGVITLISVQERTKEIGILRAIGASKRNVSGMFTAETVLIGLASGLIGVGTTWLLCIPINSILHKLTNIPNLSAILPLPVAAILVLISVLLTLFAGVIPSRSAAKKDPVVALRTE